MTAVSPKEIFLSKLVLKAEFKRFKKVNIAVKKVEMLSMLRKFFVFALVLTFMNSVVSSQIPGNNLPEKSEKGIFSKLRSKRKGSPGSQGSTEKAVKKTGIRQIAIAGGVSANSGLRNAFLKKQDTDGWNVFIPDFEFCTDNAAMIAVTGYFKYLRKEFTDQSISPYSKSQF